MAAIIPERIARFLERRIRSSRPAHEWLTVSQIQQATTPRLFDPWQPFVFSNLTNMSNYLFAFRFAYILTYSSDLLRAIFRALIGEIFRNGADVAKKYYMKCGVCFTEYDRQVEECSVCGNKEVWLYPDERNRIYLRKWLEKANLNGETLIDVLSQIEFDLNVVDNAYLVVRKKYVFNDAGEVVGAIPVEVVRGDPLRISLVFSIDGLIGWNESGDKIVATCPIHRDVYMELTPEEYEAGARRCPKCGRRLYQAVAKWTDREGAEVYFIKGEIMHIKKYTFSPGYGWPPIASMWLKIISLWKQDYFVMLSYSLFRSPGKMLVIRGVSRDAVERAWQYVMEKARLNPFMAVPVVLENVSETYGIDTINLEPDIDRAVMMNYRDELRRSIMAFYGVAPVFMGEQVGTGREALQILVTNRAIENGQRIYNEKVLLWLVRQLGVDDWVIQLRPNEMRDEEKKMRIVDLKLKMAERLKEFGYKPVVFKRGFDIDIDFERDTPEDEGIDEAVERAVLEVEEELDYVDVEDLRQRAREKYYERFRELMYLEGMPEYGFERIGEQRFEGEPPSPREELEGEGGL